MFAFLSSAVLAADWGPFQTVYPYDKSSAMLFGSSVALSPGTQCLVVGAPSSRFYEAGYVYLFEYSFEKHSWTELLRLTAKEQTALVGGVLYNVTVRGLGSSIGISDDSETIIAGAPLTSFSGRGMVYEKVGAVVIFKQTVNGWVQTLSVPPFLVPGGQYGKVLDTSSDLKFYSTAYDGNETIFVSMDNKSEWTVPASVQVGDGAVRTLEFVDASTLLAASASDVSIFKKSKSGWKKRGAINLPNQYRSAGRVSMPENDQFTVAVSVNDTTGNWILFMHRNDVERVWELQSRARYPPGSEGVYLDFCRDTFLAVIGTVENGARRVIYLFAKRDSGLFELIETIEQPEDDPYYDSELQFATSIAWDNEHCWRLAIGSVSHLYATSRVYIYQMSSITRFRAFASHAEQLAIILTIFAAVFLVAVACAVIGYLILRYRRKRAAQLRAGSHGLDLI
jgi:hypothetical protein